MSQRDPLHTRAHTHTPVEEDKPGWAGELAGLLPLLLGPEFTVTSTPRRCYTRLYAGVRMQLGRYACTHVCYACMYALR